VIIIKGKVVVISGPSGVGKSTIVKCIMDTIDAKYSVSTTTRQPRKGEVNGVDYFFVTEKEFKRKEKNGEFLETNLYEGNYYGSSKEAVYNMINAGTNVLFEVDVNGAYNIKKIFPDALLIYIAPPSIEELRQRLIDRATEPIERINERMEITNEELKRIDFYDYVIVNVELDKAIEETKKLILKKI